MKQLLPMVLLAFSSHAMADWIEFSTLPNGDVFFFDDERVEKHETQITVWTRVRYKTSVMGASSYQSYLRFDCAEKSETILQSTFYSDKDWDKPAMATNKNPKPETALKPDSATGQLAVLLCKD